MKNNSYGRGLLYDGFLCRAHKKYGNFTTEYEMLFRIQEGTSLIKISYEKQFEIIRSKIVKAFDAFLKRRLTSFEKEQLQLLKLQVINAYNVSQFDSILDKAITITQPYKNWDQLK